VPSEQYRPYAAALVTSSVVPEASLRKTIAVYYGRTICNRAGHYIFALWFLISPTRPYNTVNFGLLAAEIVSLVLGTPAK